MQEGIFDESDDPLNPSRTNAESYIFELRKIRNSRTFKLSTIFVRAFEKPWKLIFIPFNIIALFLQSVFKKTQMIVLEENFYGKNSQKKRNCIVFFPTDEDGFEHFSRSLAVAQKISQRDPNMEIIFITTMTSLNIIQDCGFPAYHIPNRKLFNDMPISVWNPILQEYIELVLDNHQPKAFIFDGNYQHFGMIKALSNSDGIFTIEIKRDIKNKSKINENKDSSKSFDVVVQLGVPFNEHQQDNSSISNVVYTDPIQLVEFEDSHLSREEVRNQLGLPLDATVVFLQNTENGYKLLGKEMSFILDALELVDVWIVIGESIVGPRFQNINNDRIRVIRDYPLTRYYQAFDFTIMAGAFETFHTSVQHSLPAICIPTIGIESESRDRRIENAVDKGFMRIVNGLSKKQLNTVIEDIMDKQTRQDMWDSVIYLHKPNGADQVSGFILENI